MNMEILTNGGGIMKKNIKQFIKQNGFLLILFISVCIVAAGTIYIATRDLNLAKEDKPDDELVILDNGEEKELIKEVSKEDEEIKEEEIEEVSKEVEDQIIEENSTDEELYIPVNTELEFVEDDFEEEENDIELVKSKKPILPVEGDIITEFAKNTLIYSKTLDDWRKHDGIDIKGKLGSDVKVPMDGVIKSVKDDDLWGIVITIEHENELETKISNLATKEMVKPGIKVEQGDIISKIGDTAEIEIMMEPHIHYEVRKNGEIVDPRSMK